MLGRLRKNTKYFGRTQTENFQNTSLERSVCTTAKCTVKENDIGDVLIIPETRKFLCPSYAWMSLTLGG